MFQNFKKMVLTVVLLFSIELMSNAQEASKEYLHGVWGCSDITRTERDGKKTKAKLAIMFVNDGNFKLGYKPENSSRIEYEGRYELKEKLIVLQFKEIGIAKMAIVVKGKNRIHLKSTEESTALQNSAFELERIDTSAKGKEDKTAPIVKTDESTTKPAVNTTVWVSGKLFEGDENKKFVRQLELKSNGKLVLDEIWEDGTLKGSWSMTYKIDGVNMKIYHLDGTIWSDTEVKFISDKSFVMIFEDGKRHIYNQNQK